MMPDTRPQQIVETDRILGPLLGTSVLGGWALVVGWGLLASGVSTWPVGLIGLWGLLATWLYTGLFIIAHDAMHGVAVPSSRRWNDLLGRVALGLYAAFPYAPMVHEHRRHHRAPASADDPDFHAEGAPAMVAWYLRFVGQYLRWQQFVILAVVFNVLHHGLGVEQWRLWAFWIVPSVASTWQLFYFGTYRPHREPAQGYADVHRAQSSAWPTWATLLSCYHFGLHWEHHAWPHVPWFRLPQARRERLRGGLSTPHSAASGAPTAVNS
jgi:beta-carotene ketolase (CrtW type)